MFDFLLRENIWEKFLNFSIFVTILVIFCSIVLFKKLFKSKSVVSPNGKAVLITGCDSGFGKQLALKLNSLGYRVYATVLNQSSAKDLIQNSEHKEQMVVHKMNVTVDEEVKEIYFKVKQDLKINHRILWTIVNNAGYGILAQLEWVELDEFKRIFEVNVFGMVRVTKMFLPLIRESKGRIINLSSILGLEIVNGYGAYCMTKHAVTAFSRTLRRELSKFGIKVVVLYPGGYKNTNFIESQFKSCDRIWNQLEDSLKNSYGNQQFFELMKKRQTFAFDYLMSDKSYHVVNDMLDAVTNSHPKKEYKPVGWRLGQFLAFILPIIPSSLPDLLDSY